MGKIIWTKKFIYSINVFYLKNIHGDSSSPIISKVIYLKSNEGFVTWLRRTFNKYLLGSLCSSILTPWRSTILSSTSPKFITDETVMWSHVKTYLRNVYLGRRCARFICPTKIHLRSVWVTLTVERGSSYQPCVIRELFTTTHLIISVVLQLSAQTREITGHKNYPLSFTNCFT